ncbi:hypothetical protein OE165_26845, partial [Escherichia coli]|uniref:hypothetical protein n=1 Tax=Escherichia coli TaxID=562 RepID=UPI0021F2BE26
QDVPEHFGSGCFFHAVFLKRTLFDIFHGCGPSSFLQDPKVTEANIKECNARCEKDRYARLKAAGLCVTCGKAPNYFGCLRC